MIVLYGKCAIAILKKEYIGIAMVYIRHGSG